MPNIAHSIQDYLKKINRSLTFTDILSLFVTVLLLLLLTLYISNKQARTMKPVVYQEGTEVKGSVFIQKDLDTQNNGRPFASSKGKTYTFSWCQGSRVISSKNKIYFATEEEAKSTGRTLSKLCKK